LWLGDPRFSIPDRSGHAASPVTEQASQESRAVFTVGERDRLQEQLLARAEADSAIVGVAFTGSQATGDSDRWSDTDLVLAVRGEHSPVVNRWTGWLRQELGALHHWDLPAGPRIIRVFPLPGWLEIDLTFAPEEEPGRAGRNGGPFPARHGRLSRSRHQTRTHSPGSAGSTPCMPTSASSVAAGGRRTLDQRHA
jgi:hypothetical protein